MATSLERSKNGLHDQITTYDENLINIGPAYFEANSSHGQNQDTKFEVVPEIFLGTKNLKWDT